MKRTMPGTRALRTFVAAGRHLNFTRAADELGLTPAAVSYHIKEIEEQLEVVLFTRSSRAIQLTPAGATLLEATTAALASLNIAIGRARRMHRGTAQLRVSLGARFATNWLLPRLPRLRAAHPHLELTFDITDQVRDFDGDDVDVAIRFGLAEPAMIAQELAQGRIVRLFDLGIGMGQKYAYHLVYPERSHAEPGISAFRAWLLSEVEAANL